MKVKASPLNLLIRFVLALSPISQIRKARIHFIGIKMKDLLSFRSWANKSQRDENMCFTRFLTECIVQPNFCVAMPTHLCFQCVRRDPSFSIAAIFPWQYASHFATS